MELMNEQKKSEPKPMSKSILNIFEKAKSIVKKEPTKEIKVVNEMTYQEKSDRYELLRLKDANPDEEISALTVVV